MTRRSLGYVQFVWTCPSCSTRNPGPRKSCSNCGAPQPEDVRFERVEQEELITDKDSVRAAQAGPDYICPYCGTRNGAQARICVQCGGDLVEARRRQAGSEMAAHVGPGEVTCAHCGARNEAGRANCSKCGSPLLRTASTATPGGAGQAEDPSPAKRRNWLLLGAIGAAAIACFAVMQLFVLPTSTVSATVADIHWRTSVPVQEMHAVQHSDESGSPPPAAYDVSCHTETRQVCMEKVIDQGNGYGEKVEDCHDESQQLCSYTVDEWQTIQTYTLEGHDFSPVYSQPIVSTGQRLGDQSAEYTVTFNTDGGPKTYSPSTLTEFTRFEIGSAWNLSLNRLGAILSIQP